MSYLQVGSAEQAFPHPPHALSGTSGLGKGPPAPPTLSNGQYGLAMSRISIPADAVTLLLLSPTFRKMTAVLDQGYVDHRRWIALQKQNAGLALAKDFRIANGTLKGRRVLYVGSDAAGSQFIPGSSIESGTGWDIIRFKLSLGASDTVPWVAAIAHESAHAVARLSAQGSGPASPVQRVRAAVRDECRTRRIEHRVLAEIALTKPGKAALAGYRAPRVHECDCERDWFPVGQKRTYLEHFVLGMDWELAAGPLASKDVQSTTSDVMAIPLLKPASSQSSSLLLDILKGAPIRPFATRFPVLATAAGHAAFTLRFVDESWRQAIRTFGQASNWLALKENRLQRHAGLLFKINVTYTKCP